MNYKILSYLINILLTVVLIAVITGGICAGALLFYVTNYIDDEIADLDIVSSESELTTTIYYMAYDDRAAKTNGRWEVLDTLHGSENRSWVKYHDTPRHLRYAFVALEDKRFYAHNGVDWGRTLRAIENYILPSEGGRDFGASTIVQQLVKSMTKDDDVTVDRKIQEIRRAMALDAKSSKQDILEAYMNDVYLAYGIYGVQAAANFYFSKDVSELTLLECVAIAAIVQAPSAMNPLRGPNDEGIDRNKVRRNAGLDIMLEEGFITQEEYDEAYDQELVLNRSQRAHEDIVKSWFVDLVIEDLISAFVEEFGVTRAIASYRIFSGGLSIYTTMDKDIQDAMEHVYTHDEYFPAQPEGAIRLQSSMVILDPSNNNVLGIVGGRGEKNEARGFCRASIARRQPGSAIKPVAVYGPALEVGLIDWGKPLIDLPYGTLNGKSWPANLPAGYQGAISLQRAVAVSKNTTAVRVLADLTPEYSFRFLSQELNVKSIVEREVSAAGVVHSDIGLPQLALGGLTHGITNLELTAGFGMFANDGIYTKPRSFTRVVDHRGNVIINNQPARNVVMSAENAHIMTRLLQSVVDSGTARGLGMRNRIQIAGKTGTTNDEKDLWFVGYTPYYICGVWFGYDTPTYINRGRGNPHLNLFNTVMDWVHQPYYDNPLEFEQPETVIRAPYCIRSGLAPVTGVCSPAMGFYARGLEPSQPCDGHVSEEEEEDDEGADEGADEPEDEQPEDEQPPEETVPDNTENPEDNNSDDSVGETEAPTEIITEAPEIITEPPPEDTLVLPTQIITEAPDYTDDEDLVQAE